MDLIDCVTCTVRIHELIIPHDLLTFIVQLFFLGEFVGNLARELELIRNFDLSCANLFSSIELFSDVAYSKRERVNISFERLL